LRCSAVKFLSGHQNQTLKNWSCNSITPLDFSTREDQWRSQPKNLGGIEKFWEGQNV